MTNDNDGCQPSLTALAEAADTATTPLERLIALRALIVLTNEQVQESARTALATGVPVAAVGRALSITRQAAHRRFIHVQKGEKPSAEPRPIKAPRAWGELRIGPGKGIRAGQIVRRA